MSYFVNMKQMYCDISLHMKIFYRRINSIDGLQKSVDE